MKIYDEENKRVLNSVTLFLTPAEAAELASSAQDLAEHPQKHHHHVSSGDCSVEITVAVYTRENAGQFDQESLEILGEELAPRPRSGQH